MSTIENKVSTSEKEVTTQIKQDDQIEIEISNFFN
jgi:hypothetical protein